MSTPTDATPLGEARDWLREHVDAGACCPLCTQFAKVYPRTLTAAIARVLIRMWHAGAGEWVYLPAIRSAGQDEAIARHFGLIEQYPDARRPDGSSRVGWWRLTAEGVAFVEGRHRIPRRARIYNNRRLGFVDELDLVDVREVLGKQFSYAELMARPEDLFT